MNWRKKLLRKSLAILLVAMLLSSAPGLTAITGKVNAQESSTGGTLPSIATVSYPFSDDVDNIAINNWLADSPWSRTGIDSHSGNTSWTDSPGDYYANNRDISLTLVSPLNLSSATKPYLKFWHRYQLEAGFDFAYVEISTDGGTNWLPPLATYSGTVTTPYNGMKLSAKPAGPETPAAIANEPWLIEQINLTSYAGQANVKIRFRIVTDGSRVQDGWYLDDITIAELPTAVTLSPIISPTRTSVNLTWSQNNDPGFRSYAIYRSLAPGTNLRSTLVNITSNQSATSFTDTGLATKTTYYYRIYVVSSFEIYNASNEQNVTTLAGVDYPFFDNLEAGPNNWLAEPGGVWTLVTPDSAHSGTKAWTESPSGDYNNNVNATITLADSLRINPLSQIIFWHRLDIASGDNASVEVLTENATAWTTLASFTNRKIASWTREQISLGTSTGNARVRFRMTTDASGTADGWLIDDIGIADIPAAVTLSAPVPQPAPNVDKMLLTWTQSTDVYFQSYRIYRGNQAGIDLTDTLVATVTTQTTTSYMDSGLLPNTVYYYKIYVVNPSQVYNGGNELSATTLAPGGMLGFPFSDDMETGPGRWVAQSPWELTQESVHSGNFSWTDSPASNYANNMNTSLQLTINLGGATMPILEFWQRYSLQENSDFGYIEASTDRGATWSRIYFVTGNSADWLYEKVDLGTYAGVAEVVLRFRFASDASGVADGWYIDDVILRETAVAIPYPFFDNLDSGEVNWVSGAWTLVSPGHTTPNTFTDSPRGPYILDNWMELVLAGTLDFRNATRPQLTFWHKYDLIDRVQSYYVNEHDYARVYVSNYYGRPGTWQQVAYYTGTQAEWTQVQIDLTSFSGLNAVRVKFVLDDNRDTDGYSGENNAQSDGWYVDDIRVQDAPRDVVLSKPAAVTMHSANLTWAKNTDANFARYEIYRNKNAAVTRTSTLVASIEDQNTTNFTDNYTILQPDNYRYRIFVVDQLNRLSVGSNEVTAVYNVPRVSYPFFDNTENGTASWEWSSPWGQTGAFAYSGNTSWTDSPVGAYTNNADTALTTSINLGLANSPVLTFWHRYSLEQNTDYGYVEISTDSGTTWIRLLSVTGNGDWNQERINLTPYAGTVVGLRFHLISNTSITADGWYLDDIRISEGASTSNYPFFDNMENGSGAWLYSSPWGQTTALAHSGNISWTDSPFGSYASNTDASLWITTNLAGAVMPIINFWQRYSLQENSDFGYIEASIDKGVTWNRIYFVTGSSDWGNVKVDLSQFTGQAELMLRFRFVSDSSGTADGWYIDDVSFEETAVTIPYPFFDNLDNGGGNWTPGAWTLVSPGHTTPNTFTDSPRGNYQLDNWMELVLAGVVDLTAASKPQLTFWHKYDLVDRVQSYYVNEHDYARVYVSNYYGRPGTWQQVAYYTGAQAEWTQVQIDLTSYVGINAVRIKFVLDDNRDTDGYSGENNAQADGWYIDDIRLTNAPRDVTVSEPTRTSLHSATLDWTRNTDNLSSFARYEIYRNKSAAVTRSNTLVAQITNQAITSFTDNYTILQPDNYRYRVWVVDQLGRYSLGSNEVTSVYTIPEVGYPFADNMENGTANWDWGQPWTQTSAFTHSGNVSWLSAPGGAYASYPTTALTTRVNLLQATSPILTFWHRYTMEQNIDYGYVEISTDAGRTWSLLFSVTGTGAWNRERLNLKAYAGTVIGLRFRMLSAGTGTGDNWAIDDVAIDEGTTSVGYPLFDNVENGLGSWFYDSPWDQTNALAHSGNTSWTDSPFGSYVENTDASLRVTINLSAAVMPILDFWHRYSLQENSDFGYVEVSKDKGISWSRVYFVTGNSADWVNEKVDLGSYAGQAEVIVRFRLISDGNGVSDGWYLDDIALKETAVPISYPFLDNLDNGEGNWISGAWTLVTPGRTTPFTFTDSPRGSYLLDNWMELVLAGNIDLTAATKPQLTFWHKYDLVDRIQSYYVNEHDYARVYVSTYYGQSGTWQQVASYTGVQSQWTRITIDLTNYAGLRAVRIKFVLDDNRDTDGYSGENNAQSDGWYIDDVKIGEADTLAPAAIANLAVRDVNTTSLSLTWTTSGDNGTAGTASEYDIRYLKDVALTDANWNTATQVSGEPKPLTAGVSQNVTISGLTAQSTYYFGMKTADFDVNWSPLSNVVAVTTLQVPVTVSLQPAKDRLEDEVFTLKLDISSVMNLDAANYEITFNPALLAVDNVTAGLIGTTNIPVDSWNQFTPGRVAVVQNLSGTTGVSGAGHLSRVQFRVLTGTSGNITSIGLANGTVSDNTSLEIAIAWVGTTVGIVPAYAGDANGDRVVNALDITKLERIIVQLDAATPGADANRDSRVNALDITKTELIIARIP